MSKSGMEWKQIGIDDRLNETLEHSGLSEPTEVQRETIPLMLAGRDVSVRSGTGTGKTLAFLLPVLQSLDAGSQAVGAVILSPTQELAMQIVRVAESYAAPLGIRVQQLIGGAALKRQVEKLKLHPQLVVGTPGRIHELLKLRKLKLHAVKHVVIDEADQTFQLGSAKELEELLFHIGKERQISFFSATYPEEMARFEGRWMKEPVRVSLAPEHRVSPTIDHYFTVCDKRDKPDAARRILRSLKPSAALLFLNDTNEIANWEAKLNYEGFAAEALYGDADKQRRAATLARFRDGRCKVLIATDVAARGIDIEGLPLVLQLEPAIDADHYVHRAGRTGRMGRPGTVVSIIAPQERFIMEKFGKKLGIDIKERILARGELLDKNGGMRNGRGAESPAKPKARAAAARVSGLQSNGSSAEAEQAGKPNAGRAGGSAKQAPRGAEAKAKIRKRDTKDKGAPKWLKEKRKSDGGK